MNVARDAEDAYNKIIDRSFLDAKLYLKNKVVSMNKITLEERRNEGKTCL